MFSRAIKSLVILQCLLVAQYACADEFGGKVSPEHTKQAKEIIQAFQKGMDQQPTVSTDELLTKDFRNLDSYLGAGKAVSKAAADMNELPNLLVFISFSMPKTTLSQLAVQVKKAGGVLVLRGVINNSIKDTIAAMHELSKQGVPAIIHPKLFKMYNVRQVPTFVMHDPEYTSVHDEKQTVIIDKMMGNVPLEYVLRQFKDEGSYQDIAKAHLVRLEGGK